MKRIPDKYASSGRCFKVGYNPLATASKSLLHQLWLWCRVNSPKWPFAWLLLWSRNFYKKTIKWKIVSNRILQSITLAGKHSMHIATKHTKIVQNKTKTEPFKIHRIYKKWNEHRQKQTTTVSYVQHWLCQHHNSYICTAYNNAISNIYYTQ